MEVITSRNGTDVANLPEREIDKKRVAILRIVSVLLKGHVD